MAKYLNIEEEIKGDVCVLSLDGELDMQASTELQQRLQKLLDGGCKKIVADMKKLRFISTAAVAVLIQMTRKARDLGGGLKLAGMTGQVRDTFRILHLDSGDETISISPSVEEALKEFKG